MNSKILKIVSLALAVTFSFGICAFAETEEQPVLISAPAFGDLAEDDWAYDSIMSLALAGIISGDQNGAINPDKGVTREEIAKMIIGARGYAVLEDIALNVTDAQSVAPWATGYVATAMEKGILKGFEDGTIRGDGVVTRAEMATIIVRSLNASTDGSKPSSFTDIKADDWYAEYVECAKTLGIVTGYEDGTFNGEALVTRREAFVMVQRLVKLLEALEA